MLIQLSKRVLDQIYYNNKAKLCEIRIRLMGTNVDLLHAIDHPRGGELFLEYLTAERAAENLHFYRAVDKFDAMCNGVRKQYAHIQKLRQQQAEQVEASLAESAEEGAVEGAEGHGGDTVADRQPRTPEPSSPGQVTPDSHSAYENSMKQSPPKRLDPIMSASNFGPSSKSGDGSARAGPIMNESEQDGPKEYAIKVKPPVRGLRPRQSSFSGRVALALAEDETDDKTELSDNDTTTKLTLVPSTATAGPGCAKGTEKLTHSASAGKVAEEVDSPEDAAAVAAMLITDKSAAPVQITATENTTGARKDRHRMSFLQAKAENMERAHEFHDRQEPPGQGNEAGEGNESSADGPSLAVQRSRVSKKIMHLTNTLRTQVVELNEVARVIMQMYVYNDASQQLNLPDAMRIRCERQFSQWCTDLAQAPRGGDISTFSSSDALEQLLNKSYAEGLFIHRGVLLRAGDQAQCYQRAARQHAKHALPQRPWRLRGVISGLALAKRGHVSDKPHDVCAVGQQRAPQPSRRLPTGDPDSAAGPRLRPAREHEQRWYSQQRGTPGDPAIAAETRNLIATHRLRDERRRHRLVVHRLVQGGQERDPEVAARRQVPSVEGNARISRFHREHQAVRQHDGEPGVLRHAPDDEGTKSGRPGHVRIGGGLCLGAIRGRRQYYSRLDSKIV
jgi:hypothetical protein